MGERETYEVDKDVKRVIRLREYVLKRVLDGTYEKRDMTYGIQTRGVRYMRKIYNWKRARYMMYKLIVNGGRYCEREKNKRNEKAKDIR